ncbi:DUF3488 and DUF4129 domain-containing transglutaminase family protein [Thermodesulfobacteriota bacterium]
MFKGTGTVCLSDRQLMNNTGKTNILPILGVLFIAISPHMMRLPVWIVLWCLGLWGYVFLSIKHHFRRPNRTALAILTLGGVSGGLMTFGFAFSLDTGAGLLSILLGLKPMEIRTHRDKMVTLFLIYFLVITNLLYVNSLPMTLYLFVCVLLITAVLIHINHPRNSLKANLRLSSLIMVQALPLMIVLFFLFPRIQGSLFAIKQKQTGVTGFTDQLTPGNIANLVRSNITAFRAEFTGDTPEPDRLYWRGIVFWNFNGRTWTRGIQVPDRLPPLTRENVVEYTLTLEPHGEKWLFALDLPVSKPAFATMKGDQILMANQKLKNRVQYTIQSGSVHDTGQLKSWERKALDLPVNGNRKALALAQKWVSEGGTPEEIIARALAFFGKNDFSYTLNPPLLDKDPVDDFLFRTRKGYCGHYASAFTFLMRAANIPSRVVAGYLGGEINPYGDYLIVRQSDAHAWSEVWIESKGWTRVDPTSAVAPERIDQGMSAALTPEDIRSLSTSHHLGMAIKGWKTIALGWDALNNYWNRWVMGYSYSRQKTILSKIGIEIGSWKGSAKAMLLAVSLAGLFILSCYFFIVFKKASRKRDAVQQIYTAFCTKLGKAGFPRRPEQGPLDYARMVSSARKDLEKRTRDIIDLYIRLRYDRGGDQDALKHFKLRVKNFDPQK